MKVSLALMVLATMFSPLAISDCIYSHSGNLNYEKCTNTQGEHWQKVWVNLGEKELLYGRDKNNQLWSGIRTVNAKTRKVVTIYHDDNGNTIAVHHSSSHNYKHLIYYYSHHGSLIIDGS